MRSTVLIIVAAVLLLAAALAGVDLTLGGNPEAIRGVIGASAAAVICAALAFIVRRMEGEDDP